MIHCFDIDIAKHVGMPAAVIFYNIYLWILHNESNGKHIHDEKAWTYNSIPAFQIQMPYLSEKIIRNALAKLIDAKYIITGNYNTSPMDRTIWYALGEAGEAFKSRNLQGESTILPKGQMHTAKRADAFAQKGGPIPDINSTDINSTSSGTGISTGNIISTGNSSSSRTHAHTHTHTSAHEKQTQPQITFGYDTDWEFHGITQQNIDYWQKHYPNADVPNELLRMASWLFANRQHRKTRIEAFITNWLARSKGEPNNGQGQGTAGTGTTGGTEEEKSRIRWSMVRPDEIALKHLLPTPDDYERHYRNDKNANGEIPF